MRECEEESREGPEDRQRLLWIGDCRAASAGVFPCGTHSVCPVPPAHGFPAQGCESLSLSDRARWDFILFFVFLSYSRVASAGIQNKSKSNYFSFIKTSKFNNFHTVDPNTMKQSPCTPPC